MILLATCACGSAVTLKKTAEELGLKPEYEIITRSDDRTRKASELGLGLPVLIRDDGAMSNNGVDWLGAPKRRKKKEPEAEPIDVVFEPIEENDGNNDNA